MSRQTPVTRSIPNELRHRLGRHLEVDAAADTPRGAVEPLAPRVDGTPPTQGIQVADSLGHELCLRLVLRLDFGEHRTHYTRMSNATQGAFAKDSWQTPRNARTLRAFMALQNQEIGARLRELRRGRPQTAVAEALEVSERAYQNWEAGDAKPSYRNLQRLAAYYGVGEDFILTGTPGGPPETPDLSRNAAGDSQLDRIEALLQANARRLEEIAAEAREQREELLGRIVDLEQNLSRRADAQTTKAMTAAIDRIAEEYAALRAAAADQVEAAQAAPGSSRRRSRQA